MAKKKSNINKYINGLELNKIYSKISRGSSFIPGVIDDTKLSGRVVKKDGSYKAKPFNKSLNNIRPILEAGFSSRGNFRTNYTIPSPQIYLLDTYSGAAAAYSVRKLSSSYSGSALRVRRSSDNAEQDIGFSGNDLDTSALTTFVGANDGFVTTWYDQSGNGNDATNSTAAQQPQIVSSGTLVTTNSKVSIDFDTDDNLSFTDITPITSFTVAKLDALSLLNYILYNVTAVRGYIYGGTLSGANGIGVFDGATKTITGEDLNQHLGYHHYTGSLFQIARDGAAATNLAAGSNFALEQVGRVSSGLSFNGKIQEIIAYPVDRSSNKSAIESLINSYYNIYWDGSQTGLLDDYPSASAAYSVRALNSAYTDPILRVRRSSDNAEQDIRALYDGNLDEDSLLSFVGAGDGFVVTWYDQSGNGNNATQSTAANQPKIVSSGSTLTQGGKSTIDFDGVNDYLSSVSNIGITGSSSRFMSVVGLRNIASPNDYYFGWGASGTGLACSLSTEPFLRFGSTTKDYSTTGTLSTQELITVDGNGINLNAYDLYHNGTIGTPATASSGTTTLNTTNSSLFVGTTINTALPLDGELQELIIWGNSQSTNRTAIESNINAYYLI